MNQEEKVELLTLIAKLQRETCDVLVRIGGVSNGNHVEHDEITILECPPRVLKEIVDWANKKSEKATFIMAEVANGGLKVY